MTALLAAMDARGRPPPGPWPMRGIVAGGILMTGPYWGLVATWIGIWRAFALMDRRQAPEPEEIFRIADLSLYGFIAGIAAFAIGTILVVWSSFAIARSRASAVQA